MLRNNTIMRVAEFYASNLVAKGEEMRLNQLMTMEERIVLDGAVAGDAVDESTEALFDVAAAPVTGQAPTAGKAAQQSSAQSGTNETATTGTTTPAHDDNAGSEAGVNAARQSEQAAASELPENGAQAELKALLAESEAEEFTTMVDTLAENALLSALDDANDAHDSSRDAVGESPVALTSGVAPLASGPDLQFVTTEYIIVGGGNYSPGDRLDVTFAIWNKGDQNVVLSPGQSIRVEFYLSLDKTYGDSADIYVGYYDITDASGLEVGSGGKYFYSNWGLSTNIDPLFLPGSIPAGTYYLVGKVDTLDAVAEADETNNTASTTVREINIPGSSANRAPVLDDHYTPTLKQQVVNETSPDGTLVSEIIPNGAITDLDGVTKAMVVTSVDNTYGYWEYSPNGGGTWVRFTNISGSVVHLDFDHGGDTTADVGKARLLAGNAKIRFVQTVAFTGDVTFTFQAWDMSDGKTNGSVGDPTVSGGSTAFSSQYDEAVLTITDNVNRPPTVGTIPDTSFNQSGQFIYDVGGYFQDEPGDKLTYSYQRIDPVTGAAMGNAEWLRINPDTGVLSGNPAVSDQGVMRISVIVTDRAGNVVDSNYFNITFGSNLNDAPEGLRDTTVTVEQGGSGAVLRPIDHDGTPEPGDGYAFGEEKSGKFTYELLSHTDRFYIDANGNIFARESTAADTYANVRVRVIDPHKAYFDDVLTVVVTAKTINPEPPKPAEPESPKPVKPNPDQNGDKTPKQPDQPESESDSGKTYSSDPLSPLFDDVIYVPPAKVPTPAIPELTPEEKEAKEAAEQQKRDRFEDYWNNTIEPIKSAAADSITSGNLHDFIDVWNKAKKQENKLNYYGGKVGNILDDYIKFMTIDQFLALISRGGSYEDLVQNIAYMPPEVFLYMDWRVIEQIPANALALLSHDQLAAIMSNLNTAFSQMSEQQLSEYRIPEQLLVFFYVREIVFGDVSVGSVTAYVDRTIPTALFNVINNSINDNFAARVTIGNILIGEGSSAYATLGNMIKAATHFYESYSEIDAKEQNQLDNLDSFMEKLGITNDVIGYIGSVQEALEVGLKEAGYSAVLSKMISTLIVDPAYQNSSREVIGNLYAMVKLIKATSDPNVIIYPRLGIDQIDANRTR